MLASLLFLLRSAAPAFDRSASCKGVIVTGAAVARGPSVCSKGCFRLTVPGLLLGLPRLLLGVLVLLAALALAAAATAPEAFAVRSGTVVVTAAAVAPALSMASAMASASLSDADCSCVEWACTRPVTRAACCACARAHAARSWRDRRTAFSNLALSAAAATRQDSHARFIAAAA